MVHVAWSRVLDVATAVSGAPILFLLIGVIALISLFSLVGLRRSAHQFERRLARTDKEIDALRDEILILRIRVNRLPQQQPSVLKFPDKISTG
jgi:hypothetical protein